MTMFGKPLRGNVVPSAKPFLRDVMRKFRRSLAPSAQETIIAIIDEELRARGLAIVQVVSPDKLAPRSTEDRYAEVSLI